MSAGNALFLLAAVWCIIYIAHSFANGSSSSLLPAHSDFQPTARRLAFHGHSHRVKTSLNLLQFKITLTNWNAAHENLTTFLFKQRRSVIGVFARWFYNLGSVTGGLGMVMAVAAMIYTCGISGWILFQNINPIISSNSGDMHYLTKRSIEDTTNTLPPRALEYPRFSSITPIVPGVTVPLSHLPIIIIVVFLSQVIHEFGHAIAAALESLQMLSAGASFTICIPAAFVSFSTTEMKALSPQARSRVIAAGPFHNIAFWCLLSLVSHSGFANLASLVSGYQNISHIGKAVIAVNLDSPLSLHLPPRAIITKLDDTSLSPSNGSSDIWTDYLKADEHNLSLGWCVATTVLAQSDECCASSHSKTLPFVCFSSIGTSEHGCIDPVPVLTKPHDHVRCSSMVECPPESTCALPKKESRLLRLTVLPSGLSADKETVVLWSGPSSEILEEVLVGDWLPRVWILPLWFPSLLSTFWQYLTMATLSLYFFNLLPLPFLDGTELLAALLDRSMEVTRDTFLFDIEDLELGEGVHESGRTRQRWKERIMRYVPYTTSVIVMLYILFAIMNAMY